MGAPRPAWLGPADDGLPEGRRTIRDDVKGGAEPHLVDEPQGIPLRAQPELPPLAEVGLPSLEQGRLAERPTLATERRSPARRRDTPRSHRSWHCPGA